MGEYAAYDAWASEWLYNARNLLTEDDKDTLNDIMADMMVKKNMTLSEFDPQWKEGVNGELILKMWCPCGRKARHRIRVPVTTAKLETPWRRNGPSFTVLTIAPSVDTGCWHGVIEDGEVKNA